MNYFDYVYKKLFKSSERPSIFVNEVIKRSQSFIKNFNSWKASDYCEEYLNEIWQSYFWSKKGVDKDPQVKILTSSRSNGLSISYEEKLNRNHFHYLFDYLADRVKKLDYRLVNSHLTIQEKGEDVETREMHYLKPKSGFEAPRDQKYGNVQIEFIRLNDRPANINLLANTYSDRAYNEPKEFEELAQHIFSTET